MMTVGVPLPGAPASVASRRVFTANGVNFTVADLARRASVGGREPVLTAGTPQQAEEAFRRARGLLTADRLEAWLASWSIAAEDFRRWTEDVAEGTTTATWWCATLCSGRFDAAVGETLAAAAAACELGEPPIDPAEFDPTGWTYRLLTARTTSDLLSKALTEHRLDWTQLQVLSALVGSRSVAEELRHQVLNGEADLRDIATNAGNAVQEITGPLSAFTPASIQPALAGARAGELIGPMRVESGWFLFQVLDRTDPSLESPQTKALAETSVHQQVISGAVARHVVT